MTAATSSQAFFESKYQADPDPWKFATSPYEIGRYKATLAALSGRRYRHAFEPGCSIGMLTAQLASLCGQVEAIDTSPTAVAQAQVRCKDLPGVCIRCGTLPADIPATPFDLIVLSEIGYYFDEPALYDLGRILAARLEGRGTLLAVHWLGYSKDHVLSGDRVHEVLMTVGGLRHSRAERHEGFRIDRWERELARHRGIYVCSFRLVMNKNCWHAACGQLSRQVLHLASAGHSTWWLWLIVRRTARWR